MLHEGSQWIEIEFSAEEQNARAVVFEVAEAARGGKVNGAPAMRDSDQDSGQTVRPEIRSRTAGRPKPATGAGKRTRILFRRILELHCGENCLE